MKNMPSCCKENELYRDLHSLLNTSKDRTARESHCSLISESIHGKENLKMRFIWILNSQDDMPEKFWQAEEWSNEILASPRSFTTSSKQTRHSANLTGKQ